MKTRLLIIGIIILVVGSILSILVLIAGQELNNQGNTDIFPDSWNATYNPTIGYIFAWLTLILIPVSIMGIPIIIYSLFSKFAKYVAIGVGILLLGIYFGIILMYVLYMG